jgi:two-component system NtrC family response regulator
MQFLVDYHWPGNVRELANVLERAILISGDRDEILPDDLPQAIVTPSMSRGERKSPLSQDGLRLDSMEKEHIEKVLELAGGNKSKAARLLGISRKKLYQKIEGN